MKTVTFTVEITTKLNDDIDPNYVYFDIDPGAHAPQIDGAACGINTGYSTTAHYIEDDNV